MHFPVLPKGYWNLLKVLANCKREYIEQCSVFLFELTWAEKTKSEVHVISLAIDSGTISSQELETVLFLTEWTQEQ